MFQYLIVYVRLTADTLSVYVIFLYNFFFAHRLK